MANGPRGTGERGCQRANLPEDSFSESSRRGGSRAAYDRLFSERKLYQVLILASLVEVLLPVIPVLLLSAAVYSCTRTAVLPDRFCDSANRIGSV